MPEETRKPDGWEKLRREGDPAGSAEVGYDPKKPGHYHVTASGGIVWHGIPEGFHFEKGELVPVTETSSAPAIHLPATPPTPAVEG